MFMVCMEPEKLSNMKCLALAVLQFGPYNFI